MNGEFVDTNVLVYSHDRSAGEKRSRAHELVVELGRTQRGLLSVQVLMEFLATVTGKIAKPIPLAAAAEIVDDFTAWTVHEPTSRDVGTAARIAQRYRISTWDAMIIHSASVLGATTLWTEVLSHGQLYEGVQVQNPFREGA
jgi:predicted nucleic acid-binding protein